MSDPTERMSEFRRDVEGGPMLPAAEVRRRGDAIRRRRRALVAVAAAVAVIAVATPVALLAGDGGQRVAPVHPAPSLSQSNLPTEADVVAPSARLDDGAPWVTASTTEGQGDTALNECFTQSLSDLGAVANWRRDFVRDSTAQGEQMQSLRTAVAEFDDAAAARAAYDTLATELQDCDQPGFQTIQTVRPDIGDVADQGIVVAGNYQPDDPDMHAVWVLNTGLVVADDRLLVATYRYGAQDFLPPAEIEQTVVNAAPRLVADPG